MTAETHEPWRKKIGEAMIRDRHRLRRQLREATTGKHPSAEAFARIQQSIASSIECARLRIGNLPSIQLDESLPIAGRAEEISSAVEQNQVVVITGETGSGKSTQLPLLCMQMGLANHGLIGHTQPRRIAARSIAARLAQQMGTTIGNQVGFKIRFTDQTRDTSYVKLMTDGILLAETQSDRFLNQYQTLIIDEAHERSLNIDFLLGYIKRILPQRPELRLIITSATIDVDRFATHFSDATGKPAPIIEVSGRTYPVEVVYRETDNESEEVHDQIVDAARELMGMGDGDILVFLPTEHDIRLAARKLRGAFANRPGRTEILPLYARLSPKQQNQVFAPHSGRRIVLATNVAESSITVPGIHYVIDTGTARISRYAPRSKVQRLPIEPISRASADQRAGRCGRIGPGICIRLYSEDDYLARPRFTTPEIRRTNLASVILQTKSLRLGDVDKFPFIDPPSPEAIRDGYKTLFELTAIDDRRNLTTLGKKLSRIPVDPRIGRILFAAAENRCLADVLIITAGLEVQDPRIRPAEKRQAADAEHEKFSDPDSDFISYLKIWDFFHRLKEDLSKSRFRKACDQNFLSMMHLQQWQDVHRQLKATVKELKLPLGRREGLDRKEHVDAIHRSLLSGFLSGVAMLGKNHEYLGNGGTKFYLWPGSGTFSRGPKWILAAEIVETSKRYGRTVARIQPNWIEPIAEHLVKRHYSDPHWSAKSQSCMAHERVTLFGIPIVASRRTAYGKIDPALARDYLIEYGLVGGEYRGKSGFFRSNQNLREEIASRAEKTRDREWIVDERVLFDFYQEHIPEDAIDTATLDSRVRRDSALNQRLTLTESDLIQRETEDAIETAFPETVQVGSMQIPLEYRFAPGETDDGVSVSVPLEGLGQLSTQQIDWLVPGRLQEKIIALIRSLPKAIRRNLVPAPDTAKIVAERITFGTGTFLGAVASELSKIAEQPISIDQFATHKIPEHLRMNIRVVDEAGSTLAEGRELTELRRELQVETEDTFVEDVNQDWNRDGIVEWDFAEIPAFFEVDRGPVKIRLYPAIVDQGDSVSLRLVDRPERARWLTEGGMVRLYALANRKSIKSQVNWLPDLERHLLPLGRILSARDAKRQLGDLLIAIGMLDPRQPIRNKEEFDERQRNSVERISMATQKIATWLPQFSTALQQANLAVGKITASRFAAARDDMVVQIEGLLTESFLTQVPWQWLEHYPRYFQAIAIRAERIAANPTRDADAQSMIERLMEKLRSVESSGFDDSVNIDELTTYRWMIEELRVSQFAQTLGTSLTVSEKRLEKQWKKVTQISTH